MGCTMTLLGKCDSEIKWRITISKDPFTIVDNITKCTKFHWLEKLCKVCSVQCKFLIMSVEVVRKLEGNGDVVSRNNAENIVDREEKKLCGIDSYKCH